MYLFICLFIFIVYIIPYMSICVGKISTPPGMEPVLGGMIPHSRSSCLLLWREVVTSLVAEREAVKHVEEPLAAKTDGNCSGMMLSKRMYEESSPSDFISGYMAKHDNLPTICYYIYISVNIYIYTYLTIFQ